MYLFKALAPQLQRHWRIKFMLNPRTQLTHKHKINPSFFTSAVTIIPCRLKKPDELPKESMGQQKRLNWEGHKGDEAIAFIKSSPSATTIFYPGKFHFVFITFIPVSPETFSEDSSTITK